MYRNGIKRYFSGFKKLFYWRGKNIPCSWREILEPRSRYLLKKIFLSKKCLLILDRRRVSWGKVRLSRFQSYILDRRIFFFWDESAPCRDFQHVVGQSGRHGFADGSLSEAQFQAPQGLVFLDENTIFVADSENHAIRQVSPYSFDGTLCKDQFWLSQSHTQTPLKMLLFCTKTTNISLILLLKHHPRVRFWIFF